MYSVSRQKGKRSKRFNGYSGAVVILPTVDSSVLECEPNIASPDDMTDGVIAVQRLQCCNHPGTIF